MLIFLYGEDVFRLREKTSEIKNKFLSHNRSGSSLSVVDGEEIKEGDLVNLITSALGAQGLFYAKRLIVIKNALSGLTKEHTDKLLKFLKKRKTIIADTSVVVLFTEDGKVLANSALFKYLQTNAKKQKFDLLAENKLEQWIVQRLQIFNPEVTIDRETIKLLIAYVGPDLFTLNNELQKLATYANKGSIGKKEVENLVHSQANESIFEAIEALSGGDKKKALRCFNQQLSQGEDVFYLFSMYIYQLRNLLKVAQWKEDGLINSYEISKRTKIHSYVVQKALHQIGNLTLPKLKYIYRKFQALDIQVKTGRSDIYLVLNKFIVEL